MSIFNLAAAPPPPGAIRVPVFLGFLFSTILFGVNIVQTYSYFTSYFRRDGVPIKVCVILTTICNILHTVFISIFITNIVVNHFGDVDYLTKADFAFTTDPALTGILGGIVQLFFAWRVKVLTKNIWLGILVAAVSLTGAATGVATAIEVGLFPAFADFINFKGVVIAWLVGAAASDILITILLTWYLQTHKTGMGRTDQIIDKIIRLTIQTGMVTSLVAIVDVILFLIEPIGYHLTFNFMLTKLYVTTLMSSLNSRKGWGFGESSRSVTSGGENQVGNISVGRFRPENPSSTLRVLRPEVFVEVESHEMDYYESPSKEGADPSPALPQKPGGVPTKLSEWRDQRALNNVV